MSRTIDEKVVEMRFDNRNFESNVQTTMSTLDKLKNALSLKGASKEAESEFASYKSGFINLKDSVNKMWSTWEYEISAKMKNMVKMFTVDPLKQGFSEYETKINSIQTIMSNTASKGTTMEDVTKVINELNTYADKTIYNFAEMTRNIGTFTAAGVGLEDSAAAIQGIANLAAASGSTSQQASTAMYQLSQALSTGTVRLMDWNSVVNAGMGGELFQEALKKTAREHGVAVDDIIKKNGSFRDSLSDGWLSADILNETLKNFTVDGAKAYAESMVKSGKYTQEQADALIKEAQSMEDAATKVKTFTQLVDTLKEAAQSGWSQTWEILFGNFEEAKELFTQVSDVIGGFIGKSADARNKTLELWKTMGGRTVLIEAISNAFQALVNIITPIKEAFTDIFPPVTAKQLLNLTKGLRDFTEKLKMGDKNADRLRRTFRGLFSVIQLIGNIIGSAVKAIFSLFGGVGKLGGGILELTANVGDFLLAFTEWVQGTNVINEVFQTIAGAVKAVLKLINGFVITPGLKFITKAFEKLGIHISGISKKTVSFKEVISGAFKEIGIEIEKSPIYKIFEAIGTALKTVGRVIKTVFGTLIDKLANADFKGLFAMLNDISLSALLIYLVKLVKGVGDTVSSFSDLKESITGVIDNVGDVIGKVGDVFGSFQKKVKAEAIMKIAIAIAILTASLVVLTLIDVNKLDEALVAITVLFGELLGSLAIFTKIGTVDFGVQKALSAMIGMAAAILILSFALKNVSSLDAEQIKKGVLAIGGLAIAFGILSKLMTSNGNIVEKGFFKTFSSGSKVAMSSLQMIALATSMLILAHAVKQFVSLEWEELGKAGVALAGLTASMAILSAVLTRKGAVSSAMSAMQLIALAGAMFIMAKACQEFAYMEWEELGKAGAALGGLALIITGLALAMNLLPADFAISAIGLVLAAGAIVILAGALKLLSFLKWDEIGRGLAALGGSLVILAAGLFAMSYGWIGALVLPIAAAGLVLLAGAMKTMSLLSWNDIGKGLVAMAGGLLVLALGLGAMILCLPGALVLPIAAAGLVLLAGAMKTMSLMSWSNVGKGLLVMAAALAVLAIGLTAMIAAIPGAIALLIAAAAFGILAVSVTALAAALAVGGSVIISSVVGLFTGLINLIPLFIQKLGEGFITLCDVVIQAAPKVAEAIIALILAALELLVKVAPELADGLLQLFVKLMEILVTYAPRIAELVMDFFIAITKAVAGKLPDLIKVGVDMLMSFITGVVEALGNIDKETLMNGIGAVDLIANVMFKLAAMAAVAPLAMGGVLAMGAVITELALVLAAVGALSRIPGLEGFIADGGDFLQVVGNAIGKFIGSIAGGLVEGFSSSLPQIGTYLSQLMTNLQPFFEGAKNIDDTVLTGVGNLAKMMLMITGVEFLDSIASFITGGNNVGQFASDLVLLGVGLNGFSQSVKDVDTVAVDSAAKALTSLSQMAATIPNKGGLWSLFAGENDMASFALKLPLLGRGLSGFSNNVAGVNVETVSAASDALVKLSEMASKIPNSGGLWALFAGDNDISSFALKLPLLGSGMSKFATNLGTFGEDQRNSITCAASALGDIAKAAESIPNDGGWAAKFAGENSLAKFSNKLPQLGTDLKSFVTNLGTFEEANVTTIKCAANAIVKMAEAANKIPNEGGWVAKFVGENSIGAFGEQLPSLGTHLKAFVGNLGTFTEDQVNTVKCATNAIAEMAKAAQSIPDGQAGWCKKLFGDDGIGAFSKQFNSLGTNLKGFVTNLGTFGEDQINTVKAAVSALKVFAELANADLKNAKKHLTDFGDDLVIFGGDISNFSDGLPSTDKFSSIADNLKKLYSALNSASDVDTDALSSTAKAIDKIKKSIEGLSSVPKDAAGSFNKALKELGESSADKLLDGFKNIKDDMKKAGKSAIDKFIDGVEAKESAVKKAGKKIAGKAVDGIEAKEDSFKSAGKSVVTGFCAGITENTYKAEAKAKAMAKAAYEAAKKALDVNSPSKIFRSLGYTIPEGMAVGIDAMSSDAVKAAIEMTKSAVRGAKESMSRITSVISENMDSQPTIRPVLDLTDIKNGAGYISGILGNGSVGVSANVGAISTMMNRRNQNGGNEDVVSAIDKLNKNLGKVGNTYNSINGVSYNDGGAVEDAIRTIVRAAIVERRV